MIDPKQLITFGCLLMLASLQGCSRESNNACEQEGGQSSLLTLAKLGRALKRTPRVLNSTALSGRV